jgi:arginyl-tRNA synthetase
MDYTQLATQLTVVLSPFLPYLISAGEATAKEIGKRLGETGFEMADSLWGKLKSSAKEPQKLNGVATALATDPDNGHLQTALAEILAQQLESSPQLAQELMDLMKKDKAVQTVLVERGSKVKDIYQQLSQAGQQTVTLSGKSQVGDIKQVQ